MGCLRHRVAQGWGQHPGPEDNCASIPLAAVCWALHHARSPEQDQALCRLDATCGKDPCWLGSAGTVGQVPRPDDPGWVAALNPGVALHPCGTRSSAASQSGYPNRVLLQGKHGGISRNPCTPNSLTGSLCAGAAPDSLGGSHPAPSCCSQALPWAPLCLPLSPPCS